MYLGLQCSSRTSDENIFPTPEIATVGVGDKVRSSKFTKEGNLLYIIGETKSEFGGSLYLKKLYNKIAGVHPEVNFDKEVKLWKLLESDTIKSAKTVGVGGIAIALYKEACVSNKGCEVNVKVDDKKDIFSETISRAIVEIAPENADKFEEEAKNSGIYVEKIGKVGGNQIKINDVEFGLEEAKNIYFNRFRNIMKNDVEGLI
jgi:phosphoribosylformylglycinamidine (FGAM) synthase-like enzyme